VILIIDNYDSFTFNLVQALGPIAGTDRPLRVVRNDALSDAEVLALAPSHVVLSPGPGDPRDAGLCLQLPDLLPRTPILGVCLGHQALALSAGGRVVRSPRPTHGRTIPIDHDGQALFAGLPQPFEAALYHSLVIEAESLPPCLRVTARGPHGDVMAIQHVDRPHSGVQFHPESFMTGRGRSLLENFLQLA
jgi:anthranilate synthase/aminodeoxychorismate synthase-like glutamine amidotransferase